MFVLLDLYIWLTCSCLGCAIGVYFGYWLRKRDEADGVVSALKTALDEQRVPDAVRQQVLVSSPTTHLLALAHWKLKHSSRRIQPAKPEDYKRCRSIASRIMLIKPLQ
jgi:hypothetical protein